MLAKLVRLLKKQLPCAQHLKPLILKTTNHDCHSPSGNGIYQDSYTHYFTSFLCFFLFSNKKKTFLIGGLLHVLPTLPTPINSQKNCPVTARPFGAKPDNGRPACRFTAGGLPFAILKS